MVLNKASICAAVDLKKQTVAVPEWGGSVILSDISATDRIAFGQAMGEEDQTKPVFMAKALVWFIVDEAGQRIFTDEDYPILASKSFHVLKRLWDAVAELSGMNQQDEAAKNS